MNEINLTRSDVADVDKLWTNNRRCNLARSSAATPTVLLGMHTVQHGSVPERNDEICGRLGHNPIFGGRANFFLTIFGLTLTKKVYVKVFFF